MSNEENKVVAFPGSETPNEIETPGTPAEDGYVNPLLDADGNPLPAEKGGTEDLENMVDEKQLTQLLKTMQEMMGMLEAQWNSTRQEFSLTDTQMKDLYDFNEQNRIPAPEGLDPEKYEEEGYDPFNGLRKLTGADLEVIFGAGHPILIDPMKGKIKKEINQKQDDFIKGVPQADDKSEEEIEKMRQEAEAYVENQIVLDRVSSVMHDFINWMTAIKEYRQVHDAYMELIEYKEEQEMKKLLVIAEACEDPVEKEKMMKAYDLYYNRKYLDFLQEEVPEQTIKRLLSAFTDEKKVAYWIEKTRNKLKQLKISDKFILELSQFEKRFLDEKYHPQSNIFLLYFMSIVMYADTYDKKSTDRSKAVCIVFALDRFIRNTWKDETRERILSNIIAFEDQLLPVIAYITKKETVEE